MKDIYWIQHENQPKLAIVSRPRGGDWLEDDVSKMRQHGIDVLVSMLTSEESRELGLANEKAVAEQLGISFRWFSIPDRTVPEDAREFREFIQILADDIHKGQRVGIHCRACIGRATITAASILHALGWSSASALSLVEEARGCPVPDTAEQRNWILCFQPR